jgi:hypothetical protein
MIIFAPQKYKKNMKNKQYKYFKNIMSDFAATHNPFNQNLNYEKILRFSVTKVIQFFDIPIIFAKKHNFYVNFSKIATGVVIIM